MSINAQPFSPTFKLVGNLTADQILVYDASENAFVNATNTGASGSVGLSTSVLNTGTGKDNNRIRTRIKESYWNKSYYHR